MTIYQTKLQALERRMENFSVAIVQHCKPHLSEPALRSSTSIGANYAEANNASSKTDFKSKIYIAKKEAAETRYWLNVLSKLLPEENFASLQQEALEFNLILQKIISTLKSEKQLVNKK